MTELKLNQKMLKFMSQPMNPSVYDYFQDPKWDILNQSIKNNDRFALDRLGILIRYTFKNKKSQLGWSTSSDNLHVYHNLAIEKHIHDILEQYEGEDLKKKIDEFREIILDNIKNKFGIPKFNKCIDAFNAVYNSEALTEQTEEEEEEEFNEEEEENNEEEFNEEEEGNNEEEKEEI